MALSLTTKSQVKSTFAAFKTLVENRFQAKIRTLYSDNGGEFIALREFLVTHGISHLTSPPHTPEHNGLSERKHRHIVETGLTLLTQASIPREYWPYAFSTAVYLINRMPTPVLSLVSPFQKLFGSHPNYERLHVFGCLCFPWLRPYTRNKLEERSKRCVFLGYSLTQTAYLCLDVENNRLYTSRHVVFDESVFPFSIPTQSREQSLPCSSSLPATSGSPCSILHPTPPPVPLPAPLPANSTPLLSSLQQTSPMTSPPQVRVSPTLSSSSSSLNSEPTAPPENGHEPEAQSKSPFIGPLPNPNPETQTSSSTNSQPVDTSTSTSKSPNQTSDIAVAQPPHQPPQNQHPMRTRSKNNIAKPKLKTSLTVALSKNKSMEPTTVTQALKDEKWRFAMSDEFDAQQRNHTWDLVPNTNQHLVGCSV